MLPFCDRTATVSRKDVAPVWTRSFPIAKEPATLGEHLRRKRFSTGLRQEEAARLLGVSLGALSAWERDRIYPSVDMQHRLVVYLGFDPFASFSAGRPKATKQAALPFFHAIRR